MLRRHAAVTLVLVALGAFPRGGYAQNGGSGFLFHEPRVSVTLRTGWDAARAHSDLFAFTTRQLTINRGDFSSFALGADIAWRLWPRTSVVLSVGSSSASKDSEFREFVDNNELPIQQTTAFSRVPVTFGIKQYLTATGRTVGKFAWIPARITPFVGAGAGVLHYRFHQSGDFVDFQAMDVFASQFTSAGWTPTAHAFAGLDYSLGPRFALTSEARYLWSKAALSRDFSGFQKLDLSGLATTAGITVRF